MSKNLKLKVSAQNVTKIFAGAAALTLVTGGGLVFWLNGCLASVQANEINLQAQVGSSEKIAKQLQDTQALYDQACGKIAVLETSVTQKSYVPTLLQQIERLAAETNLTITNINPGQITAAAAPPAPARTDSTDGSNTVTKKAPPPPSYNTMNVELNVTGSYADTNRFVYGLTRFPKIMSVVSIQMSPGQSGPSGAPPVVTTNLKLTAYVFPDDDITPAAGTSTTAATQNTAATNPAPAAATYAGAAGHAAQSAVAATRAANGRAADAARVLY